MRYEVTNLDQETIFETNNLRTALVFMTRYAKENPETIRLVLQDNESYQLIAVTFRNGKMSKIHHYLHDERSTIAERAPKKINQNLAQVERYTKSLGYNLEVEYDPLGGFLDKE